MICYYLLDRLFFFRLYLLTVLNEKKFAVSDKKAKNVTNPRRARRETHSFMFCDNREFQYKRVVNGELASKDLV